MCDVLLRGSNTDLRSATRAPTDHVLSAQLPRSHSNNASCEFISPFFYFSLTHSGASVMSYLKWSVIYLRPPCFCQVDSVRAAGIKEIFQSIHRRNSTTKSQAYPFRRLIFNLFLFHTHMHLRFSSDMI